MPIIKNNLYHALTTETITKPVSAVKLQLDILDGCKHTCPGCFVRRRGNASTAEEMADMNKFVQGIASTGILIDEIIIGPTDFLSSENFYEVMPYLYDMINEHSPILAFITTLLDDDVLTWTNWLRENINLNTEIEIGIAIDPNKFSDKNYLQNIHNKLKLIDDNVEHDTTFTFLVNIKDYGLDYDDLHAQIVDKFKTTFDLIPSVSRSHRPNIILAAIDKFNDYFNQLPKTTKLNNIMVDHSHAGMNYNVLNYKTGEWYLSPFLYENMSIYDDMFKINSFDDVHKIIEQQIERAANTECNDCPFLFSCMNRKIILLRDYLGVDRCIAPKENMLKHMHNYNEAGHIMYDWNSYTVEKDKNGYRKKFTANNDEELADIVAKSYI